MVSVALKVRSMILVGVKMSALHNGLLSLKEFVSNVNYQKSLLVAFAVLKAKSMTTMSVLILALL